MSTFTLQPHGHELAGGVAGAVLTGGRSRRFGRPKAVEPVRDRPMAAIVTAVLVEAGLDPVQLIGGDPELLGALEVAMLPDLWPGEGPLGGVITALRSNDTDVVVAACDLPYLDAATVVAVMAAGENPQVGAAVAVADGRHVPLVRWNRSALPALESRFSLGERSLRGVLDHVGAVAVHVDPHVVRDVDTPDQLNQLNQLYQPHQPNQ
jgi:molybdopterin-guanine dinucleotide biosynthesis protein A